MSVPETVVPKGSTVLVTGANGYIGSNIINKLLQLGYRVHGTVRDQVGRSWVADEMFSEASKNGAFKLFEVNDMSVPNAFGDAIVGASAICFIGTNDMSGIPEKVIPGETTSVTNLLDTATDTPTVKRFVLLSTSATAAMPGSDVPFHVTRNTWNDLHPRLMHKLPPGPEKSMAVYISSKIEAEKLVWKFREERRPHFSINVVNSSFCLGKKLNKRQMGSTVWIKWLFAGDTSFMPMLPSGKFSIQALY
jgi:nucleoside-diphosphate-sugar epimerase